MQPVISWQQKLFRNIRRYTNATFLRHGGYRATTEVASHLSITSAAASEFHAWRSMPCVANQ
jgi:hypothetical protein